MTKFTKILWGGVIALSLTACTTFMLSNAPLTTIAYGTRVIELIGNNSWGWGGSVGPNPGINTQMHIQ